MAETIFSFATPPGRSGVAVLRVSGSEAWVAVERLAGNLPPVRRAGLRVLRDPVSNCVIDSGLVLHFDPACSFTGEQVAEMQVHGSTIVRRLLLDCLGGMSGLREAEAGEFTRRAFQNGRLDLGGVEGLGDLLCAETEAQNRQALRLSSGALANAALAWRSDLLDALAHLEASIDFADEDIPDGCEIVAVRLAAVVAELRCEIELSGVAERLREGFEVAIVGEPNVGKSTLLNALTRRETALVSDVPGTTRDILEVRLELDGLPISILDWDEVALQVADEVPQRFSFVPGLPLERQVTCGVTHTNERTHEIIRKNLHSSAMFNGSITSVGPRYCPSVEDKIYRFPKRAAHQVFLEPEGLASRLVYPNGLSTSLPPAVQQELVRSIKGLRSATIEQPGYAVEYDYIDPRNLDDRLQVKRLPALFFAGQINGTTGYEEAAGQGLVAGINAAATASGRPWLRLDRSTAYIGVMIDDLVTKGVTEPYRMFTARAEFRLQMRADNADRRVTSLGIEIGCISPRRRLVFARKMDALEQANTTLEHLPASTLEDGLDISSSRRDGSSRSIKEILGQFAGDLGAVCAAHPEIDAIETEVLQQIAFDSHYAPYLARQDAEVAELRRDEAISLPDNLAYWAMAGLSAELTEKLSRVQPATLAQASRIEGMTPTALSLVLLEVRKRQIEAPESL